MNTLPHGWNFIRFDDFTTLQRGKDLIKRQFNSGHVPVAGSNGVIGFHDEAFVKAPGITVGRSGSCGRVNFYTVDFWAHNTSLYVRDFHGNDEKFAFYLLIFLDLGRFRTGASVPTLDRNSFKELLLTIPPIFEQRRIAHVLSTVQTAIEQQQHLIALTRELKSTLMKKLFTEGLYGEGQKETEIGLIPESWNVSTLESLLDKTELVNIKREGGRNIKYIDVSSISREYLRIEAATEYMLKNAPGRARKKVIQGDVIFATVRPTLLRVAFINKDFDGQVCSTAFCVLRAKREISNKYLYYVVQRDEFIKQLAAIESGASYPAVTDNQLKAQMIPLPEKDECDQIADILFAVDQRLYVLAKKMQSLENLFKTLLHLLMTGEVRTDNLDLPDIL